MFRSSIRLLALSAVIVLAPVGAIAQTSPPPAAPAAPSAPLLKPAELDQLVAPIALYPDPLLAEVLMASSYPLDIVEAERWLQSNKNLSGDALKAAADKQDWDDSIKALVATPSVLDMMSQKLDWTQKLGDAVVAQQADVMDAIQRLRAKAQANNKLSSTKEQSVTVSTVENRQVIAIEPTDPNTLYVPYYDPGVVYGDWPYPDYPPYYWPTPGYIGAGIIATGIAFGTGYALGRWASGGNYWGGGVNWGNRNLNINRPTNPIANPGRNWQPRVDHRQNAGNRGGRQQGGLDFRGNNGQQVIKPGGNRGNGNLAGQNRPTNRPSTGGAGNRPHAGTRPSGGGQRHKAAQRPSGGGARVSHRGGGGGGGGARVSHRAAGGGGGGARVAPRGGGGGGGGMRAGGGGGHRGGGGGGRGRGGRRSDIRLKHDIVLLGHLDDGLGFYRFSYNGSDKAYVGVMAQEVEQVMPQAVARGRDGYLTVNYDRLGLKFESYDRWLGSGGQIPHVVPLQH
jgi:hypothetical protein